jgi:ferrochelatase
VTVNPFDAVLVIAFGGPGGTADIRPFLENVLRGRSGGGGAPPLKKVSPGRVEEVAHHYELFGGVSPITALTQRQAAGLQERLRCDGPVGGRALPLKLDLPVYVGMRNWHPFLADTLRQMADDGVRHAIGFIAAAHGSFSSCGQYRQNVLDARLGLRAQSGRDIDVTYVGSWYAHPGFIAANAAHVRAAGARLPPELRDRARVVFTAHSIPLTMAETCKYREQLAESCRLVAEAAGRADWTLVYQSRSGRPEDPWLDPDVCDYLRAERTRGLPAVILCPIGFVCDHIEVLYDLDHEAAQVCAGIGLPMARAETVNDDPLFLDMMADVVRQTWKRYGGGRSLPIAPPV